MSSVLKGLNEGRNYGRDSWDSNMPGYQGDYGGAENFGRRNREWDEDDRIDARIRAEYEKKKEYEQNGKFWLKLKDSQRHLPSGPFVGKQSANQAAIDLLKQQPELKGNLVITAYGPDEQVNELSNNTLASYKKKAGADASRADKEGDYARGNKRFSGIVKATKKQFAKDEKGVAEGPEFDKWADERAASQLHKLKPGMVRDRKTGKWYDPNKEFDKKMNSPEVIAQMKRMAQKEDVAEGVAETLPMDDAVKVLRQYGADHFKTTSNELHFYKQGRPFSVDLVMNPDATRSVTLRSLNSATRGLKGQGVAEDQLDELKCWSGYTRVQGVPAGAPGSCKKKTNEEDVAEATGDVKFDKMLKGITGKKEVAKQQKIDTKQQARDAFGGMFGGGNPADKLSIRKKGVAEGSDDKNRIASKKIILKNLIKIAKEQGNLQRVQELEMELKKLDQEGVAEGSSGVSVRQWANQVRKDHGADVKFKNRQEGGGAVDSVIARNSQGETVGVYNRKTGYPTVYEPKQGIAEEQHSCPHCGGEMVSEELMNEKKDACYYKVKSRYKVWPSAYASGALVKCRKSGADSWGDGGKKNESSILEGIEQVDENLNKWFKEKWVRFGPDGKIRGDCARGDDSEGKPKCLPQSKAQSLGKEGRASAASRKRREDPNPERSGKAINVNTKKK
jgi:hypothetical protein